MRALLASPVGFLVGLSLGALGGGGSILAVPALVYVAGQEPKEAIATSLVVVAIVSAVGVVPHWRAGHVRIRRGLVFAAAGVAGAIVGSAANHAVDPELLLLLFSGVMIVAAVAMLRRRPSSCPEQSPPPLAGTAPTVTMDARMVLEVAGAGTVVGLMTGFFGVGGGFLVVPALVLALRFDMADAIGTSLLVISINSVVALLARLGSGHLDWAVVIPFAVTGLAGVATGSRIAEHVDASRLMRWFALLLIAVAIYTAVRTASAV